MLEQKKWEILGKCGGIAESRMPGWGESPGSWGLYLGLLHSGPWRKTIY